MAKGEARGVVLGYLRYVLGFDNLEFQEGLADSDKRMKVAQKSLQKTADKLKTIGAALSVGVSGPLIAFAAQAVQGAKDQAAAVAQVDAAIKSMGNAAGLSSDQLAKFADQLEMNSLVDADEILRKSTANLLTFGNIAGESFLKAQQAAVDMAARMGTDVQSASIMVGKALNDPIKGLTALSKAGIQFTDQQKTQIKTMQEAGNIAGAQAIMLGELNRQFGGAAEAAAKAEPMRQVMVKLGQAGDAIGEKLLPLIPVLAESVGSMLDGFTSLSPETQKWVVIIGALATGIGPVVLGMAGLVSGFSALLPVITTVAGFMTATLIPNLALLVTALAPILVPLAAVAAAVGAVYLAWKNWDAITGFVQRLYQSVKTWVLDKLNAVWAGVKAKIDAVKGWFFGLYDAVVGHSYIPDMVDEIGQNMARLDALMVDPAQKATQKAGDAFRAMAQRVGGIIDELFPKAAQLREEMARLIDLQNDKSLSNDVRQAAIDKQIGRVLSARDAATAEASPALGNIEPVAGLLEDAYAGVAKAGADAAKRIGAANDNAGQSFVDMANTSLNALSNLAQSIKGGGILDIISSTFNAFGSIAKSGLLGSKLSSAFSGFTAISGFRANGGPVSAGRSYIVGEKGPELFTASRSGYVHANGSDVGGRSQKLEVIPSPYFNVVVDGRVLAVAAPMSVQAATGASVGAQRAVARRNDRRLA